MSTTLKATREPARYGDPVSRHLRALVITMLTVTALLALAFVAITHLHTSGISDIPNPSTTTSAPIDLPTSTP